MSASFQENVAAIDSRLTKLSDENKRMRRLLNDVALLVACQPPSSATARWLAEVEELTR